MVVRGDECSRPFCESQRSLPVPPSHYLRSCLPAMHLLYLDESASGSANGPQWVLGGFTVEDVQVGALRTSIVRIAELIPSPIANRELHASPMETGRRGWRGVPRTLRNQITNELLACFSIFRIKPFAVVASDFEQPDPRIDVHTRLFQQVNEYFEREYRDTPRRYLVILDETPLRKRIQSLAAESNVVPGTNARDDYPFGSMIEVPMFLDSELSRLLQLADFVAFWVHRAYAIGDQRILNLLLPAFDQEPGGPIRGLVHLTGNHRTCDCAACRSRR